jgi:hypothetical protein
MIARLAGCICVAAPLTAAPAAQVDSVGLNAQSTVRALAVLGPRVAGSATERRAAAVVTARFAKLGLTPVVQAVPLPRGGASRNLVFRTGGGPLRAIVVAHLDGVSAGPAANDNGSGIGALLEVARLLGDRPGVLYAALGAEERVMTGSKLHLGSARLLRSLGPADRRSVRLVLSLDSGTEARPACVVPPGPRPVRPRGVHPRRDPGCVGRVALGPVLAHGLRSHRARRPGEALRGDPASSGCGPRYLTQRFADPVVDRGQLQLRAGDILQQLVRGGLVAQGPQLAQE